MCWCFGGHLHVFLLMFYLPMGFPDGSDGKESTWMQETQVWSLGWEGPRSREWLPTPVFLPGELHGQRSLMGYSPWGLKKSDMTEWLTFWFTLLYLPIVIFVFCNETDFFHDTIALWESLNFPYLCFFCSLFVENVCMFVSVCACMLERSNEGSAFTAYILKKNVFWEGIFLVRLNIYKLNYRIIGFLKCQVGLRKHHYEQS